MSKSKSKKKTRFKKDDGSKQRVTFRVLAKQALSIDVSKRIEDLTIQGVKCRIAVKPAHLDPAKQRELGESTLAVEFEAPGSVDLFAAARDGFELIEDFLSAITVVSGATFAPCELVQVARLAGSGKENCGFIQFLPLPLNHWHERVSDEKLMAARKLLAHWDGLENGHRLRRAARSYRYAAGTVDDVSAFQKPHRALISSMHYLHRAICACSHSSELGGEQYRLARGGVEFVMFGDYTVSTWPDLGDWSQILETTPFAWKPHPEYELVPELNFRNPRLTDLRVGVGKLTRPLSVATTNDIGRVRFERE